MLLDVMQIKFHDLFVKRDFDIMLCIPNLPICA